jgi:hypothetical protein
LDIEKWVALNAEIPGCSFKKEVFEKQKKKKGKFFESLPLPEQGS